MKRKIQITTLCELNESEKNVLLKKYSPNIQLPVSISPAVSSQVSTISEPVEPSVPISLLTKNHKKKILTVIAFVAVFLMGIGVTLAVSYFWNMFENFISPSENNNYSFDGNTLTIYSNEYFYSDFKKFKGSYDKPSTIENVTINSNVTKIGNDAFKYFTNITNIIIPDSVTYIGGSAFAYCTALTNIEIPDSVTYIGGSAFAYCINLTTVTIPNNITTLGYTFDGCINLTSVMIPDSVTHINAGTFKGCQNLTDITIPDSVVSIGSYTFDGCTTLTSINIPDSVTNIGICAFNDCSNLKIVTIPEKIKNVDEAAFYGWTQEQTICIKGKSNAPDTWDKNWDYGCNAAIVWNA